MIVRLRRQVTEKALGWLSKHIPQFDPLVDDPVKAFARTKALAEALLVVELAPPGLRRHRALQALCGLADGTSSHPLFRARTLRTPRAFTLYLAPSVTRLLTTGTISPQTRQIASQVLSEPYSHLIADAPFREMDALRTLHRFRSGRACATPLSVVVVRSLLARRLSPLEFSRDDVYNFTHLVFYATDWGRDKWQFGRTTLNYVRCATLELIGLWINSKDWDLIGELLIVAELTGISETKAVRKAFQLLASAQLPDGTFPHPKRLRHNFNDVYHTVVVVLILCMLILRPRSATLSKSFYAEVPKGLRKLAARGLARVAKLATSHATPPTIGGAVKELLEDTLVLPKERQVMSIASIGGTSYWPLLAAVSANDLIGVGTFLVRRGGGVPAKVGYDVLAWLFLRQGLDGHFGSFEPERRQLRARLGKSFDFESEVQWPSTLAVVAGLQQFLGDISHRSSTGGPRALPNFGVKLSRPGFGPAAELPTSAPA